MVKIKNDSNQTAYVKNEQGKTIASIPPHSSNTLKIFGGMILAIAGKVLPIGEAVGLIVVTKIIEFLIE